MTKLITLEGNSGMIRKGVFPKKQTPIKPVLSKPMPMMKPVQITRINKGNQLKPIVVKQPNNSSQSEILKKLKAPKNFTLNDHLKKKIQEKGLKVTPQQYSKIVKTIADRYEQKIKQTANQSLKGFDLEPEELLGYSEFEISDSVELLGAGAFLEKPHIVGQLQKVKYRKIPHCRPTLKKALVDNLQVLSGDEFDSMTDEELLGFLKKFFKGVGKVAKGIGKGIGKVAKGIGKGIGAVGKVIGKGVGAAVKGIGKVLKEAGKFVGKNWKNIIKIPLALIPGGSMVLALAEQVLNEQPQEEQTGQPPITQEYIPEPELSTETPYNETGYESYIEPEQPYYEETYIEPQEQYYEQSYSEPEEMYYEEPEEMYYEDEGELLGSLSDILKKIGAAGKKVSGAVLNFLKKNPEIQFQILNMKPAEQMNYVMKLQQGLQANINKEIIDQQTKLLYTTQVGKQQAQFFGSEFFSQWGIPLMIGAAFFLLSGSNKRKA